MIEDRISDTTIEDQEINKHFEELEITNSTCNKINWKDSKFDYLEITNSKINNCIFSNINLSEQTFYKVVRNFP